MTAPRKLLILVGSPRCAGNSATLATAVQRGAEATGAQVALRFVDDFIASFLRDCRACRLPSGECAIRVAGIFASKYTLSRKSQ
jgi:multimeric flavodoxin WrbA